MSRTTTVAARLGLLALTALLQTLPNLVLAASPLRLECSQEQQIPGRALVCEYSILGLRNSELADLHDRAVREGRSDRLDARRWLSERDACRDVDCLDNVFERRIRAARIALVDTETRQPALILANARGVPVRVLAETPRVSPTIALEGESGRPAGARTPSAREASRTGIPFEIFLLLLVAAAVLYTVVVVRISRPR